MGLQTYSSWFLRSHVLLILVFCTMLTIVLVYYYVYQRKTTREVICPANDRWKRGWLRLRLSWTI